jgi:hypothetical protein
MGVWGPFGAPRYKGATGFDGDFEVQAASRGFSPLVK